MDTDTSSVQSIQLDEKVLSRIYRIRGLNAMPDRDLAELYGVEATYLKRQVRRHIERFPDDFKFELTSAELEKWRCLLGTSN